MSVEILAEERINQPRPRLHLLYHELRSGSSDYLYIIETKQFDEHVKLYAQMQDVECDSLYPEITFDDGHFSDFEYALPILQARGIYARFFITVGWTGTKAGYMGWSELRELHRSGQLIGAHGWSHTLLTHCTPRELERELVGAKETLEDKLGTSITTMSLPGGRANQRVLAACREAGYVHVYTSEPRSELVPLGFQVGRLNILRDMSLEWIDSVLQPRNRALSSLHRQYRLKLSAKLLLGDSLYEKLWSLINRKEADNGGNEDKAQ